jgi:hypothetical protein
MLDNLQQQNNSDVSSSIPKNILENNKVIDIKYRNPFQVYLMLEMGVIKGNTESEMKWINENRKLVSGIIDGKVGEDFEKIKPLIIEGKYEEASEYVLKTLTAFKASTEQLYN